MVLGFLIIRIMSKVLTSQNSNLPSDYLDKYANTDDDQRTVCIARRYEDSSRCKCSVTAVALVLVMG